MLQTSCLHILKSQRTQQTHVARHRRRRHRLRWHSLTWACCSVSWELEFSEAEAEKEIDRPGEADQKPDQLDDRAQTGRQTLEEDKSADSERQSEDTETKSGERRLRAGSKRQQIRLFTGGRGRAQRWLFVSVGAGTCRF